MTAESISFVCRNAACTGEETNRQELIFHQKGNEELFECPACKRLYKENDGNVLYKPLAAKEEVMHIDSLESYLALLDECKATSLYIPRLHISGIKEAAYDGKIISFSKCIIDELIIEDIEIKSSFYPISLSECKVSNFIIRNCSIIYSGIKDYYSPWSFYGINLYKVEVSGQFDIEGLSSSMMIMDSNIENPINIRNKSKVEMALLHNQHDPEIISDKGSKYQQVFEASGKGTDVEKKIKTNGKALKGSNIDVLEIDPNIQTKTIVENCRIKELILPDDMTNHSLLYFRNCYIENIKGKPLIFERDVVFLGCTFVNELPMLGAKFKQSLIMEACLFHRSAPLNDLKIDKDLHLSYSSFMQGLHLSLLDIQGFATMHFILCNGDTKLDNLRIGRDITIRNISTKGVLSMKSCKVGGNVFFKRGSIEKEFELNWCEAGDLNIDDLHIKGNVEFNNLQLAGAMIMDYNVHYGETEMSFSRINGEIILGNTICHGDLKMSFNEAKIFGLTGMDFKQKFSIDTCQIENKFMFYNCYFDKEINIDSSSFKDFSFSYNHVHNVMTMSNFQGSSIEFTDNMFTRDFNLKESIGGNLKWESNYVQFDLSIFDMELRNINITEGFVGNNFIMSYLKAYDIGISACKFFHVAEFNNIIANNLDIINTQFLPYPNHLRTDEWEEQNKDITESLIIRYLKANNINFNDNNTEIQCTISNTSVSLLKFYDNKFIDKLEVNSPEVEKLVFARNQTSQVGFINGKVEELIFREGTYNGPFKINNLSTGKDLEIYKCTFHYGAGIYFCGIGKDLEFSNNQCQDDFQLRNCRIGNDINLEENTYHNRFFIGMNTINGNVNMADKLVRKDMVFKSNNIHGNLMLNNTIFYYSFLMDENTVGQQLVLNSSKFYEIAFEVSELEWKVEFEPLLSMPKYSFRTTTPLTFVRNKFNYVHFNKCEFDYMLNFHQNVVQGKLKWGQRTSGQEGFSGIFFNYGVSMNENRIRAIEMNNLAFKSGICQRNNLIEAGYTLFNTDFDQTFDLTGSFVGGTFSFEKRDKYEDGHLILDNTYIDKRIRFVQTEPRSISFINATFNGFEIPSSWKMRGKRLINSDAEPKNKNLFRESDLIKVDPWESELPYSIIRSYCKSVDMIVGIPSKWAQLQWHSLHDSKALEDYSIKIPGFSKMMEHHELIDECISNNFVSVYLGFYNEREMGEVIGISNYFAFTELKSDDEKIQVIIDRFQEFFRGFFYALKFNIQRKIHWENENDKKFRHLYKYALNDNLHEQYQVLRGIYGGNGELENEDTAYYWWKHYLNTSEMQGASWKRKLRNGFKSVFYETIFGWGVKLPRIVLSTLIMVLIFAGIYGIMFLSMPELYVMWDNTKVFAPDIGPIRWIVFALQTTFSAVLGDWAPIGAGIIKIPMTINAILGVLFVTFLIGAYGRKMLR